MPMEELRGGTSSSAGTPTYYIFAGGQRVASLEGSTYTYYHQDHLGGTALATDSTGTVVQLYDYYPYGSELLDSQPTGASVPSEHSFTDKELDDDLGLYYFEARWYDSDIGRFSSQDPAQWTQVENLLIDPQALNFYGYSRNNPLSYVDPDGELFGLVFAALLVAAFSGVQVVNAPDNVSPTVPAIPQSQINKELLVSSVEMVLVNKATEVVFGAVAASFGATASKTETTVIGYYRGGAGYTKVAEDMGAKSFNISKDAWKTMSAEERWAANTKFLDDAMANGDNIVLSETVNSIDEVSGTFRKELDYFVENGYKLADDGASMIKE